MNDSFLRSLLARIAARYANGQKHSTTVAFVELRMYEQNPLAPQGLDAQVTVPVLSMTDCTAAQHPVTAPPACATVEGHKVVPSCKMHTAVAAPMFCALSKFAVGSDAGQSLGDRQAAAPLRLQSTQWPGAI